MSPHIDTENGVNGHEPVPELVPAVPGPVSTPSVAPEPTARQFPKSTYLKPAPEDAVLDLLGVGFGPACISIACALHDTLEKGKLPAQPNVLFLEKQSEFNWHAGMLLPGTKMQISFIKDLASLRDPRSNFTFLNYLHKNDRLLDFINLNTFTPARAEYEDYLRWCARHFDDVVHYQTEVVSITPVEADRPAKTFEVTARDLRTGAVKTYRAKNVVVALGGQGYLPEVFPRNHPRIIHSSQFAYTVPKLLADRNAPYRIAVVGGGQSAAEIFMNLQNTYPNCKTYMVVRADFLRPSDDSPFINGIFNPEFIETFYPQSSASRARLLADAKATNYSVVRLELIEALFEVMYHQKRTLGSDERVWPHRILSGRHILSVEDSPNGGVHLKLEGGAGNDGPVEEIEVDMVVCATGYERKAHLELLKGVYNLLPEVDGSKLSEAERKDRWVVETGKGSTTTSRVMQVGRDYAVRFAEQAVAPGSGVWLQGCNEATHGLSDTLLSVLGTRSGEMVRSIFGISA